MKTYYKTTQEEWLEKVELSHPSGRLCHPSGRMYHPTGSICLHGGELELVLIHVDKLLQSHLPFLTGVGATYEKQYLKLPA